MPNNPDPQNVVFRKVTVGTTNGETIISEGHKIFGPYAQDITVSTLATGNKKVIPITDNTGEGAHFLKLTFPDPTDGNSISNSTLYITFCKKDATYTDGYREYETNLPNSFISNLKTWIDNGRSPLQSSQVRYRKLTFVCYGRQTLQPENSLTFETRFAYTGVVIGGGTPQGSGIDFPSLPNSPSPVINTNGATGSGTQQQVPATR